jgi:hypothetical protein
MEDRGAEDEKDEGGAGPELNDLGVVGSHDPWSVAVWVVSHRDCASRENFVL